MAIGILIGLLIVTHPVAGALAWTRLFASFFTVIGLFRLVAAIWLRYPSWGWAVFDGIVTVVLGLLLWAGIPWSGLWFLGLALGIALILRGWSTVMFALAVRAIGHIADRVPWHRPIVEHHSPSKCEVGQNQSEMRSIRPSTYKARGQLSRPTVGSQ